MYTVGAPGIVFKEGIRDRLEVGDQAKNNVTTHDLIDDLFPSLIQTINHNIAKKIKNFSEQLPIHHAAS